MPAMNIGDSHDIRQLPIRASSILKAGYKYQLKRTKSK